MSEHEQPSLVGRQSTTKQRHSLPTFGQLGAAQQRVFGKSCALHW